jgi:hypothetical protein
MWAQLDADSDSGLLESAGGSCTPVRLHATKATPAVIIRPAYSCKSYSQVAKGLLHAPNRQLLRVWSRIRTLTPCASEHASNHMWTPIVALIVAVVAPVLDPTDTHVHFVLRSIFPGGLRHAPTALLVLAHSLQPRASGSTLGGVQPAACGCGCGGKAGWQEQTASIRAQR